MPEEAQILMDADLSREERFEALTDKVHELVRNPLSTWAVAATIESLGIRDVDARTDYGFDSVFDLADAVFSTIKKRIREDSGSPEKEEVKLGSASESILMFFRHYSKGMLFSIPMISQIAAILIFEYALWAWFEFNVAQATMVALGTIAAFIVTGGFIQVFGRLISKYIGEENYYLTWKSAQRILKLAIPSVVGIGLLFLLINLLLPFYPQRMILIAFVYYLFISGMLLSAAILFASEQRAIIIAAILAGTAMVIFGMEVLDLGIYISQWVGILSVTIILWVYIYLYFQFKIRSNRQQLFKQSLPGSEVSYYNNYRYFIYGLCYFSFLFIDRLMAWSAGVPPPPYLIWFNTPYELGMDWALITLVLTVAVLEFSIHLFSKRLIPAQKRAPITGMKFFNRYFSRLYLLQVLLFLIVSVISILVTYYGVLSLRVFENDIPEIRDFFANPITFKVFWMGSIGYVFLIYGLMNSLFFFTMNRPEFVVYSIIPALIMNFVVGYLSSRLIGFEYATIGLISGSVVFAVISGITAIRFFKHLDYFYYSAY